MADKKIAVLIPCYNEEKTIEKVVRDFMHCIPNAYIYVYDNNSTDNSVNIVKNISDDRVILKYEYLQGKGNVVRRMFQSIDADCYIMVDADDTYPVDMASKMASEVLDNNVDMVIGDRLSTTYKNENKRPFHNFGNNLVRFLINSLFKSDIKDIMTGYRAFSKRFAKSFPIVSKGFEIETEMTIFALDRNMYIKSIPVEYRDRPYGSVSKLSTYSDGMKVLLTIFRLFKDFRPLFFFFYIALTLWIMATIFVMPILITYMNEGIVPRFPTFIFSCFLYIAGLQSLFTGLTLDMIKNKNKEDFEHFLMQIK